MRISTVIPLYNGAKYIEAAMASVVSQTRPTHEIIVVNDGSTDEGPAIVARLAKSHPTTLLHQRNAGQSSARNAGIRIASSELIALLDQDDVWHPDHLEVLAAPFETAPPSLGWVYGNCNEMDPAGNIVSINFLDRFPSPDNRSPHPKTTLEDCIRVDAYVCTSGAIYRRATLLDVGGYDERLCGYEDDDLVWRMFDAGYANIFIDRPVFDWRMHPDRTAYSDRIRTSRSVYAGKLMARYVSGPHAETIIKRMLTNLHLELASYLRLGKQKEVIAVAADIGLKVSRTGSLSERLWFLPMRPFLTSYSAVAWMHRAGLVETFCIQKAR